MSTSITVRGIPCPINQRVKQVARRNHRSLNNEINACLYLTGEFTAAAERLCDENPAWAAPVLWRSELRNILATRIRAGHLDLNAARTIQQQAEQLLYSRGFTVDSARVP